jgi:hypothetical protein
MFFLSVVQTPLTAVEDNEIIALHGKGNVGD